MTISNHSNKENTMTVTRPAKLTSMDDIFAWVKENAATEAENIRFVELMEKTHKTFSEECAGQNLSITLASGYIDLETHGTCTAWFLIMQADLESSRTSIALIVDQEIGKLHSARIVPTGTPEHRIQ